jgi:hypothetical protein
MEANPLAFRAIRAKFLAVRIAELALSFGHFSSINYCRASILFAAQSLEPLFHSRISFPIYNMRRSDFLAPIVLSNSAIVSTLTIPQSCAGQGPKKQHAALLLFSRSA